MKQWGAKSVAFTQVEAWGQVPHSPRTRLYYTQLRTGETLADVQQASGVELPHTGDRPRAKHNPNVVPQAISTTKVVIGTDSILSPRQGKVRSGAAGDSTGDKAAA